ncbi:MULTISPECIES: methyl-accepting chemotaxis protein [Clostridia]|uniref:methyl-accepting chemotaxis protein n=1 Tax=Clostridia TaxID=186801 RepID=UPI000EA19C9E|nr:MULTISPECIES: methyl-accepting chemotaxis protein [Clostridia]NBJ70041.1 methyl-accepting chemotaxis protein [Roseburia sp. 1XD42-34]RKI77404.1 methyl-accepting chemotaxis protein [Clostridium sp. 1xD42-85]
MQKKKIKKSTNEKKKLKTIRKKFIFTWRNLRIHKKYLAVFFLTIALLLTSSVIVYVQLKGGQKDIQKVNELQEQTNKISQLAIIIQAKDVQSADYLITENTKYFNAFEDYQEQFDQIAQQLEKTMDGKKQKTIFNDILQNNASIDEAFMERMVTSVEEGREQFANTIRHYSGRLRTDTMTLVNHLLEQTQEQQAAAIAEAEGSSNRSVYILAITNLLALVIGIPFMIIVSRGITARLQSIVHSTKEVASGNLQVKQEEDRAKDEIGQLAQSVHTMKERIRDIIHSVQMAASSVSTQSGQLTKSASEVKESNHQIAATMEELASGTEAQSTGANELSEKMNRFVDNVHISEQRGNEVMTDASDVQQWTTDSSKLMEQSVQQMNQIDTIMEQAVQQVRGLDEQSNQISKLIKVIRDIAEQTNLLSLNAAIEAARAGEHGRGFAVVTDEVRKLSEQVAQSVGEITTIVQRIQSETSEVVASLHQGYDEVKTGKQQIEDTGSNFQQMNCAITSMIEKMQAISIKLKENTTTSESMDQLVKEMASISQESAAGVEQVAASTEETTSTMEQVSYNVDELAELAAELNKQVNVFKL